MVFKFVSNLLPTFHFQRSFLCSYYEYELTSGRHLLLREIARNVYHIIFIFNSCEQNSVSCVLFLAQSLLLLNFVGVVG